jgi:hypothetical protein
LLHKRAGSGYKGEFSEFAVKSAAGEGGINVWLKHETKKVLRNMKTCEGDFTSHQECACERVEMWQGYDEVGGITVESASDNGSGGFTRVARGVSGTCRSLSISNVERTRDDRRRIRQTGLGSNSVQRRTCTRKWYTAM